MALPNGRVMMGDSLTPSMLSPGSFSPTNENLQSVTSSTFDNASLDELDRIMDTLTTLSRETSLARGPNDGKGFALPFPHGSEKTGQRSHPTGTERESTTAYSSTIPYSSTSTTRGFPVQTSVSIPPPMTSPPDTPVAQSPRHYTPHPKIMTMSAMPSHQRQGMSGINEARNPATVPRLPSNPYENTSILHGSHMLRPSMLNKEQPTPYNPHPEIPYANKQRNNGTQGQNFFGPLPVSPQENTPAELYPPPMGPKPASMMSHSLADEIERHARHPSQHGNNRGDEFGSVRRGNSNFHRTDENTESNTLPAYNEKRSYLKNLEEGTLPRPRVDSERQGTPKNLTPNVGRKLNKQTKPSLTEDAGEILNRLSLRRPSKNFSKRQPGRFGLNNLSKTPSRHSTTSFNSFDMGRGYASVSTAPASTHGLIQHEILPHGRKNLEPSPLVKPDSPDSSKEHEAESCCIRCGRFLYSHLLELFILVAFCAGLPSGIVIQASGFHSTPEFQKYFTFWGSTMLPMVLSTITPLLIVSSMLAGMGNLAANVLKRLILLSALFYVLSTFTAVCIAIAFSFIIKPGSPIALNISVPSSNSISSSLPTNEEFWLGNTFLRDDGLHVNALTKDNLFYEASSVGNSRVYDETLDLIRFFFPGCGSPANQYSGSICNVFALALFAGVIGIGASIMGLEGGPIRHVLSQVGTMMSNMADILLWYVPVGIFFYISEIVATRIDWTAIGQDRSSSTSNSGNISYQPDDVNPISDATKWFFITVILSLGIYCLVIMPLVVSLITLSNPFSLIGFRSVSPLLTATTVGFSDLCIPTTLRCLIRGKGTSRYCKPQEKVDRRIARVSAVLGGIFHRAGSAIVITCSATFLLQAQTMNASVGTIILICISAMTTSVTSLDGRWFYGVDPFLRATVISLSTAGTSLPSGIPTNVLCLWLLSRLAAFADTIIDLFAAQIMNKACKSKIRDATVGKDNFKDETNTDANHVGNRVRETAIVGNRRAAARSISGETSDNEEAPLLFSRTAADAGNESSSMNSRNDDSVFLPSGPQDARTNQQANAGNSSSHHRPEGHNDMNGMANTGINNRDEMSFVTF